MTIALTQGQIDALLNQATEILPGAATPFERAMVATMLHHGIDVPIADLWNPARCPLILLPYLAWSFSVDIWHDDWPEHTKRRMVAEAFELHALKGTLEGISRYAAFEGGEVVRAITPPATAFLSDDMTLDDRRRFMERLPEIRIYTEAERGTAGLSAFCGELDDPDPSIFDVDEDGNFAAFYLDSPAARMMGRRARLYRNGTVTDLIISDAVDSSGQVIGGAERYLFPGDGNGAGFLDGLPVEQDYFGEATSPASYVTVSIQAQGIDGLEGLIAARVTLAPIALVPIKVAEVSVAIDGVYSDTIADDFHFVEDVSATHLYDSIRLHDRTVDVIGGGAISFMGYERFGIDAHTAELAVAIRDVRLAEAADTFVWGFWIDTPPTAMNRVLDAIAAASAAHETILVDTEVDRPALIGGDLFIGSFRIGQPVRG